MPLRNSVSYYTYQQEITERMYDYSWSHKRHISELYTPLRCQQKKKNF